MKLDTEKVIEKYKDRIFAIGLSILKDPDDAEDVVQETFLKYHTYKKDFESKEHIQSWLYKVAINKAKDIQRKFWRRKQVSIEDYMATIPFDTPQDEELFQAVMLCHQSIVLLFICITMKIIQLKKLLNN